MKELEKYLEQKIKEADEVINKEYERLINAQDAENRIASQDILNEWMGRQGAYMDILKKIRGEQFRF